MVKGNIKCLDKIKKFVQTLKKHFEVEGVYLFGSQAKGMAEKDSDIDLVVIARYFEGMLPMDRLVLLGKLAWKAGVPEIEAIGYTPKEFDQAKPWDFHAEIRRAGISVV